jgi:integrase
MRAKITLRVISSLSPGEKDVFVWDTDTKGFGLKLTIAGSIVYLVQTRLGRSLKRYTIGRHGAPWTPDMARREAVRILGKIAEGEAPASKREEKRKACTVAELCDLYLAEGCHLKRPSTLATDRGRILRHIKPLLGARRVGEVTRAYIERFMVDVADGKSAADVRTGSRGRAIVKGGKGTASRTVGLLGAIFQFAVHRSLIEVNPVRGIRRYPDRKCERFLATAEIAALGAALSEAEASGTEDPIAIAAIRFLLLTGCRRGEVLSLKWDWVDFEQRLIRFPDSKTGAKVIPLGAPALEILNKLPAVMTNPHVFASTSGIGPIGRLPEAWERIRTAAGLGEVRIHDLRHSFASVGAAGGQSLLMIGKLLGHRTASSTQRYAHLADDPLRMTADRIAGEIAACLAGAPPVRPIILSKTRARTRAAGAA